MAVYPSLVAGSVGSDGRYHLDVLGRPLKSALPLSVLRGWGQTAFVSLAALGSLVLCLENNRMSRVGMMEEQEICGFPCDNHR